MRTTTDVHGVWRGKVVPYQRQTRRQRHTGYETSKRAIGGHMLSRFYGLSNGQMSLPAITWPFFFGLLVSVPKTSAGLLPGNCGDFDNHIKAWLDAAQKAALIPGDDARFFRGICTAPGGGFSRFEMGSEWRFSWQFLPA